MKTIALLLVIILFSCQKEEIKPIHIPSNAEQVIVGTWNVDAVQLWNGHTLKEVHTPTQTLEFTADGLLIVKGQGVGGTTLTEDVYEYTVNSDQYFLRITEKGIIYQGCLVYLRQEGGKWILGFSRPTGSNTNILWQYHCTMK